MLYIAHAPICNPMLVNIARHHRTSAVPQEQVVGTWTWRCEATVNIAVRLTICAVQDQILIELDLNAAASKPAARMANIRSCSGAKVKIVPTWFPRLEGCLDRLRTLEWQIKVTINQPVG